MNISASSRRGWILILYLGALTALAYPASAQRIVELVNPTARKVKVIRQSTRIAYQLIGDAPGTVRKGKITVVADSGLWIDDTFVPADSLLAMGERVGIAKSLIGLGSIAVGTLMVFTISSRSGLGIVQYVAGQALIGTGLIQFVFNTIKFFNRKLYSVADGWRIHIRKLPVKPQKRNRADASDSPVVSG